ncbi:MAG: DUF3052 domain-containing protein [Salibacteraceae bacterium]
MKKLGLKTGLKTWLINPPDYYFELLGDVPPGIIWVGEETESIDFLHLFAINTSFLEAKLPIAVHLLSKTGMLWISWPKKTSPLHQDLNGKHVRLAGLEAGLIDTKVCALDVHWSGQRFMYRKTDR